MQFERLSLYPTLMGAADRPLGLCRGGSGAEHGERKRPSLRQKDNTPYASGLSEQFFERTMLIKVLKSRIGLSEAGAR